jgi:hypothetical protein
MGFFSAIFDAAKEANDEARGERLLQDVQSSFASMEHLDLNIQYLAMMGYLQIRARLIEQMPNWSREGRINIGREMQKQARETFATDMAGGYAKWLAGAWLESQERNSLKAQQAFLLIEDFTEYIRQVTR